MSDKFPRILGIVNITADSFSDGGQFLEADAAITHAQDLQKDGAWAVDLGPASSHPDAQAVTADEEITRLGPVVNAINDAGGRWSLDSPQAKTQAWALANGASVLNDISGFPDPSQYGLLADSHATLIVMHSLEGGNKAQRSSASPETIVDQALRFFHNRVSALIDAGIAPERLVLDPGMGFFVGDDPQCSLQLLRHLPRLQTEFGLPLLVSVSRKSFLQKTVSRAVADVGAASLAAELYAIMLGAAWIRTHDVQALSDALHVWEALREE